jgi:regulator of sigma E protease
VRPNDLLPGVFLLGLVVFVHELGHFLAAKWRRVRVLKFSLGFGPALFKLVRGGTEYRLSWVPLGGYVQMAGDAPTDEGTMPGGPDEYLSHPWPGRLLIAAAGPLMNLVTAYVVLVVVAVTGVSYPDYPNQLGALADTSVAWHAGARGGDRVVAVNDHPVKSWIEIFLVQSRESEKRPVTVTLERGGERRIVRLEPAEREPFFSSLKRRPDPPVVGNVVTGMPAYKAGLKAGDRILAVNGAAVRSWDDLPPALRSEVDRPVTLRVERGGKAFDLVVTPMNAGGGPGPNGRIGIEPPSQGVYIERHGLIESLGLAGGATLDVLGSVYAGMWLTATHPVYYREYVGGPIFIVQAASEQARHGLDYYLRFLAMINVAIMAFNLLPIPVLDGGHILLALIEAVRRRTISARAYLRFQKAGLVVIGTLLVLILANDPWRVLQRQRAIERAPRETVVAPPGGR